jgi:hypothetical protein
MQLSQDEHERPQAAKTVAVLVGNHLDGLASTLEDFDLL